MTSPAQTPDPGHPTVTGSHWPPAGYDPGWQERAWEAFQSMYCEVDTPQGYRRLPRKIKKRYRVKPCHTIPCGTWVYVEGPRARARTRAAHTAYRARRRCRRG